MRNVVKCIESIVFKSSFNRFSSSLSKQAKNRHRFLSKTDSIDTRPTTLEMMSTQNESTVIDMTQCNNQLPDFDHSHWIYFNMIIKKLLSQFFTELKTANKRNLKRGKEKFHRCTANVNN